MTSSRMATRKRLDWSPPSWEESWTNAEKMFGFGKDISMNDFKPGSIGLVMIVKNEAKVIERCLASVRPILSYWTIVDTGSTDGTQDIIRQFMADIPGELYERPWKDFAHNRT